MEGRSRGGGSCWLGATILQFAGRNSCMFRRFGQNPGAPPRDDVPLRRVPKCTVSRRWFAVIVCDSFTRSNYTQRFFLGNRLRCLCGNATVAVAMRFAMKNGQICFSLRKFLAISLAIQKIASDRGCDAVVHLAADSTQPPRFEEKKVRFCRRAVLANAQYDWTTGVLDNGNEWRKFRAVPRLYPLRSLVCTLFNKGGSRGAFRLPGGGGDHFHCAVEPSPGHIRCRFWLRVSL